MRMAVIKLVVVTAALWTATSPAPRRSAHSRQPRRTGRAVSGPVRPRARIRRTRRDRRAVPVGLHAGAEHGAERAHLRDASRSARLSRRALDRPARADVCRTGSLARRCSRPILPPCAAGSAAAADYRRGYCCCAGANSPRSIRCAGDGVVGWAKARFAPCPPYEVEVTSLPSGNSPSRGCRTCRRTCQNPWRRRSCRTAWSRCRHRPAP